MEKKKLLQPQAEKETINLPASDEHKRAWLEPRLSFVQPKLTKHGDLKELTGFFGGFTPPPIL
jgi:hypothetical protein